MGILLSDWCKENNKINIINEWYVEENGTMPSELLSKSGKKVSWKCQTCNGVWKATVSDRTRGTGCPYCAGKKAIVGVNDLKTVCPKLAIEWNYEKNENLKPEFVLPNSGKKVWWKCQAGHEWNATIDSRKRGNGCPYCAGQRVLQGENDLATLFPYLAEEWNYDKNEALMPNEIMPNSGKKVWWKCNEGHEWYVSPNSRVSQNTGCPICSKELKTSFPEQAIFYYLSQCTTAINRYLEGKYEIDIYLPELKIGIEYDGIYFHRGKEAELRERSKNEFCIKKGIELYRIKETITSSKCEDRIFYCVVKQGSSALEEAIDWILGILNNRGIEVRKVNVDIERDKRNIWKNYITMEKDNSVFNKCPDLIQEWNFEKNEGLNPETFSIGSHKKVWWICSKGHEWEASVMHRANTKMKTGCPYCSGQKVKEGFNDLATLRPDLVKEWDFKQNTNINPANISANSTQKVWWVCPEGHSYDATIHKRNQGRNCPICSGKRILVGYNDFASKSPNLVEEWNLEKNGALLPTGVTFGSNKKVWWKCKEGHEWMALVNKRSQGKGNCPICRKR